MDCQGTGDNKKGSTELDHLILFLGVRMANVQIVNVRSSIKNDDLTHLEVSGHLNSLLCLFCTLLKS